VGSFAQISPVQRFSDEGVPFPAFPSRNTVHQTLEGKKPRFSVTIGKRTQKEPPVAHEGRLIQAILSLIETTRNEVGLKALSNAIKEFGITGATVALNLDERMDAIARGSGLSSRTNSLLDAFQTAYREGAQRELAALGKVPIQKENIGFKMTFDFLEPEALAFLQSYAFELIRQINQETRLAIQDVLVRAFQHGGHPYEQARRIRDFIGLTRSQARAVQNYQNMLESGDSALMRTALERALRDRRFDSTLLTAIQQQATLPQSRIDRMVEQYRKRAIMARAKAIARTETIRANEAGRSAVWRQALRQGLIDSNRTRRKWIVSYDERLCPICRSIAATNKKGVGMDEAFQSPNGPVQAPPAHPNCRCTLGLMFER
jgi:hypothetical protein